jgi:hypothetical protein
VDIDAPSFNYIINDHYLADDIDLYFLVKIYEDHPRTKNKEGTYLFLSRLSNHEERTLREREIFYCVASLACNCSRLCLFLG